MDFKIAVLAGDGIGPEISVQGVEVMSAVCEKFGHKVDYEFRKRLSGYARMLTPCFFLP